MDIGPHHDPSPYTGPSHQPEIHRPRYPMGQPCPCGSGKKYKHCCFHKEKPGRWPLIIGSSMLILVVILLIFAIVQNFV